MTTLGANPHRTVADGLSAFAGRPLERLAAQVGQTPFFAYDRAAVSERIRSVKAALPDRIQLSYAIKANPMPALVQHVAALVDGFDVASANEMATALDAGMPARRISFAGPGKTDDELRRAIAADVTVELESPNEAVRAIRVGAELGIRPRAAIRVNPDFSVRGSGMRMGGGPQQFGIDSESVAGLVAGLHPDDIEIVGFHVFAGSQNLNAEILCDAQRKTVDLVTTLAESLPSPISYVNLGGGFGIPYFPKDEPLDLGAVGSNLDQLAANLDAGWSGARIVIELGRFIVGEAGVYVTRVIDKKVSRGSTFLVVDGGLHHQLAASGNFGQVIRKNYPVTVATTGPVSSSETVSVVGCLCTPLDLLGDAMDLPVADVGDLIVVFQAGAYGLTASPTAFLDHPPPVEVLL